MSEIIPKLVAHRGYSHRYPENTLLSFEQAFLQGACFVECDVQLSKDMVPVILHDAELSRTAGSEGTVQELVYQQLKTRFVNFQQRFADEFSGLQIPALSEFVTLMKRWPTRRAFVEIKRASIRHFGHEPVLQHVLQLLESVKSQVALISFDLEIIRQIRSIAGWQTGWVIEQWDENNLQLAQQLDPEYMFVDYECLPLDLELLPQMSWQWVLYEIDDPQLALEWINRGAAMVETNDIGNLLSLTEFSRGACNDNSVL